MLLLWQRWAPETSLSALPSPSPRTWCSGGAARSIGHAAVTVAPASPAANTAEWTEQLSPALEGEVWGLAAVAGYAAKSSGESVFIPWVIDSGCTQHMTSDRSLFEKFEAASGRNVRVATATMTPVEGVGTVLLTVQMNDGHNERVRLHKVLYVQALEMNLLSVYQAAQSGAKIDFHTQPGSVTMSLDHRQVTCRATNKLYVLHSAGPAAAALAVRPDLTLDLLHQRFGHTSKPILRKMAFSKMASGMEFKPEQETSQCDLCELGTKRRATFRKNPRAGLDGCNNVVHSDIAGPVGLPSIKLERYVLLFVDDYSRYCSVWLPRKRSEMFQCFLEYKAAVETKHNRSFRRFVGDNDGEYLDGAFVKYCRDHGIQRDTTIAYTPEQNGMAEDRFRILFNKVRTILISSGSPKQLWGEAVLAMVYTYNRTLASDIGVTQYKRWHGHPPDVSNLRTFGSLAYVYVASKTNA
ncbi:Integrase core domain [Phytophthora infestans]|uniref:Integrase core domain n=1 Tax=Phytophthora infestans TaxID=4787 RepID=A0A8S9VAE5_PHYIN|nr:Integrase core domain [Phytophthora infestans]